MSEEHQQQVLKNARLEQQSSELKEEVKKLGELNHEMAEFVTAKEKLESTIAGFNSEFKRLNERHECHVSENCKTIHDVKANIRRMEAQTEEMKALPVEETAKLWEQYSVLTTQHNQLIHFLRINGHEDLAQAILSPNEGERLRAIREVGKKAKKEGEYFVLGEQEIERIAPTLYERERNVSFREEDVRIQLGGIERETERLNEVAQRQEKEAQRLAAEAEQIAQKRSQLASTEALAERLANRQPLSMGTPDTSGVVSFNITDEGYREYTMQANGNEFSGGLYRDERITQDLKKRGGDGMMFDVRVSPTEANQAYNFEHNPRGFKSDSDGD